MAALRATLPSSQVAWLEKVARCRTLPWASTLKSMASASCHVGVTTVVTSSHRVGLDFRVL
jgi:hypothetical protein